MEDPPSVTAFAEAHRALLPRTLLDGWYALEEDERDELHHMVRLGDRLNECLDLLLHVPPTYVFGVTERTVFALSGQPERRRQLVAWLAHEAARVHELWRHFQERLGPQQGRLKARATRWARWWAGQRSTFLHTVLPWTESPTSAEPDRLEEYNEALARWREGMDDEAPPKRKRYALFLQAIQCYMWRHGICMYNGRFCVPVEGTGGHGLVAYTRPKAPEQDLVHEMVDTKKLIWSIVGRLPDIDRATQEDPAALGDVQRVIELLHVQQPDSTVVPQVRPLQRMFAVPGRGMLLIADPPAAGRKRNADGEPVFRAGEMRPCCRLVPFEELPEGDATFRTIPAEAWTEGGEAMPLGWLAVVPGNGLEARADPPSSTPEGREYQEYLAARGRGRHRHWLARRPGEPDAAWLERFRAQFRPVERAGSALEIWLRTEDTYHIADLWEAWDECFQRWRRALPPTLRLADMTPPELEAAARARRDELLAAWVAALPPALREAGRLEQAAWADAELAARAAAGEPAGALGLDVDLLDRLEPLPFPFAGTLLGVAGAPLQVMAMQRYSDQQMYMLWTMMGKGLYWGRLCTNWQLMLLLSGHSRTGKGILLGLFEDWLTGDEIHTVQEGDKDKFSLGEVNDCSVFLMPDIQEFGPTSVTLTDFLKMVAHELFAFRAMKTMPKPNPFMPHTYMATNNWQLLRKALAMGTRAVELTHYEEILARGRLVGNLDRWRRDTAGATLCLAVRCLAAVAAPACVGPTGSMQTSMPAACRDRRIRLEQTTDFARFFDPSRVWVRYERGAVAPVEEVLARLGAVRTRPGAQPARIFLDDPDMLAALRERGFSVDEGGFRHLCLTDDLSPTWTEEPEDP